MMAPPGPGEEGDRPLEGMTILGLQPRLLAWETLVPPPGVVIEAAEVGLTSRGWGYLIAHLAPVPPDWPEAMPSGGGLRVRRLVLAAGMATPPRFGDDGWLLLSDERETGAIAALVLSPHGVHFLNHARHQRFADRWPHRVSQLHAFLRDQALSAAETVFEEDLVLELYGIRRSHELRFLTLGDPGPLAPPFVANDAQLVHHGLGKRALVENPRYHLQVDGLTFVSFERLRRMKDRRRGVIDRNDLAMMRGLEEGEHWRLVLGGCVDVVLVGLLRLRHLGGVVARGLGASRRRRRDGVSPPRR